MSHETISRQTRRYLPRAVYNNYVDYFIFPPLALHALLQSLTLHIHKLQFTVWESDSRLMSKEFQSPLMTVSGTRRTDRVRFRVWGKPVDVIRIWKTPTRRLVCFYNIDSVAEEERIFKFMNRFARPRRNGRGHTIPGWFLHEVEIALAYRPAFGLIPRDVIHWLCEHVSLKNGRRGQIGVYEKDGTVTYYWGYEGSIHKTSRGIRLYEKTVETDKVAWFEIQIGRAKFRKTLKFPGLLRSFRLKDYVVFREFDSASAEASILRRLKRRASRFSTNEDRKNPELLKARAAEMTRRIQSEGKAPAFLPKQIERWRELFPKTPADKDQYFPKLPILAMLARNSMWRRHSNDDDPDVQSAG